MSACVTPLSIVLGLIWAKPNFPSLFCLSLKRRMEGGLTCVVSRSRDLGPFPSLDMHA